MYWCLQYLEVEVEAPELEVEVEAPEIEVELEIDILSLV